MNIRFSLVFFLSLFSIGVQAQATLSTKSKKAIEYYTLADNFRVRGHYRQAVELLQKAIDKDDEFIEAYERMGLVYRMANNFSLARQYYGQAHDLIANPKAYSRIYLSVGELDLQMGEYNKAVVSLEKYLSLITARDKYYPKASQLLENAKFAQQSMENAVDIKVVPLSDVVNQYTMQYFPVLTADQETLIFTRRKGDGPNDDEDLVVSTLNQNGEWTDPVSISDSINTLLNEGTCTISADGRTLIFTSCQGRNGYGSCDLYISYKKGAAWSQPSNMGPSINSSEWESQPSLSADGRVLYYVSTRRGGLGGQDIWVSYIDEEGNWSKPTNLGDAINTRGNEISPFIHANNQTLFFASTGHLGMGGFDLYSSTKTNNAFQKPVNLGYPINNGFDQLSLFVTADSKKGYYSYEDHSESHRSSKLYQFDMPPELQVENKSNYIKGRVLDSISHKPLAASIELYNTETNQRIALSSSDAITGEYLMVLTEGADYALYVQAEGYLFESTKFQYNEVEDHKPIEKNVLLSPIKKGAVTTLNNIYFKHDEYELDQRSLTELEVIVAFMQANPSVKMEIAGHTDNTGSAAYNLDLSKKRAQAVYSYLVEQQNIPHTALHYRGYGHQFPKLPNDSAENRGVNRRIEFKVL